MYNLMLHDARLPTSKDTSCPELSSTHRTSSALALSSTMTRKSRLLKTQGMWRSAERLYCKFKHLTLHSRQDDAGCCSCHKGSTVRKRALKVEYVYSSQQGLGDSDSDGDEIECYGQPPPCHGIPSFNLTSLCDGQVVAKVPVENFPAGDIFVRVYHNRLCFRIHKHNPEFDDSHTITRAFHYGDTDIPVFVDAFSLTFQLMENQLDISGKLKSVSSPTFLSLSTGDIPKLHKRRKGKKGSSPKISSPKTLARSILLKKNCQKQRTDDYAFRERAYTR